jgi:ATP-dependent Clp protease adaptor protein ClpS
MGAKESGQLDVADEIEIKEPGKSVVILHNDDYTTMEFVLEVLQKFFRKTHEESMQIMLSVHHQGHGVAGIYPTDIAETKVLQVTQYAKTHEYPLRVTTEPA